MLKRVLAVLLFFFSAIFLSGCSLKKSPAALQISTTPTASVFIDTKMVGKTPYSASDLKEGEITVKLIPDSEEKALVSWEGKVKLASGVLTLIEREFAETEGSSSGQILSLEPTKDKKNASFSIISDPDGALIKINGEAKGFAPLMLDSFAEGDYEISVFKEGFAERKIKAKAAVGYKLIVNVKLAQAEVVPTTTPTPTTTGTASSKATITPRPTTTTGDIARPYVLIKDTPTGWLRVRADATTSAEEVAKVNPGEKYPLLDEKSGWIKISFDNKQGWVSGQYVTKYE